MPKHDAGHDRQRLSPNQTKNQLTKRLNPGNETGGRNRGHVAPTSCLGMLQTFQCSLALFDGCFDQVYANFTFVILCNSCQSIFNTSPGLLTMQLQPVVLLRCEAPCLRAMRPGPKSTIAYCSRRSYKLADDWGLKLSIQISSCSDIAYK